MKEESLIGGYENLAYIHIKTSDERIEFSCSIGFGSLLKDSLVTDNGQTVGARNRAMLHDRLDAWLNETWEKT